MTNLKARLEQLEREALGDDVLRLEDLVQGDPMREARMPPRLAKICRLIVETPDSSKREPAAGGTQ